MAHNFLQKYLHAELSSGVDTLKENIRSIRYLISDSDLKYLEDLLEKGSLLLHYQLQESRLHTIAEAQHNRSQFNTKEQSEWNIAINKINEVNIWFSQRIENIRKEI